MSEMQKIFNRFLTKICGKQTMLNLRYMQFLMIQNDDQKLPKYKSEIEQLKKQTVIKTASILGGSFLLHVLLSLKVQFIGAKTIPSVLFDLLWYTASIWGYLYLVQKPIQQKDNIYRKIQKQMYEKKNTEYLKFIRQNSQSFDIHVDYQTRNMNFSQEQLNNFMQIIRQATSKNNDSI